MLSFPSKKYAALVPTTIVSILILVVGFLLLSNIITNTASKAQEKTAESICKASVVVKERTHRDLEVGLVRIGSVSSPLYCKTIEKRIPQSEEASKDHIKRQFSELMASCWNQFGEGKIEDVFKKGNPMTNSCFVCYIVSLGESKNFERGEMIESVDLLRYMFGEPYKYPFRGTDCENNNGVCSEVNPDTGRYISFNNLRCQLSENKCFVEKDEFYSYGDYIQSFGGDGKLALLADLKPGETYAISFGSPTDDCAWCDSAGYVATAAGVILGGALSGGSLWLVGAGALAGGVVGNIIGKAGSELTVDAIELFQGRKIHTIYLSTLEEIQQEELCSIVDSIPDQ